MILFANGVLVFECSCSAMSIRLLIKIKETAYLVEAARLMYSRGCVKVKSRPGHDRAHETLSFLPSPPSPPPLRVGSPYSDIDLMQLPLRLPRLRAAAIAHFCLALSLILCSFALDLSSLPLLPLPPPPDRSLSRSSTSASPRVSQVFGRSDSREVVWSRAWMEVETLAR